MSKLSVIAVLSVALFKNTFCSENSDLLSVIVIYRHGTRAPRGTYKNDPYKDISNWGAEHGHLNNVGLMQLYELGKWLRERYNGFLPKKYSKKDFQVISSDLDRSLMSAATCLADLYPPEDEHIWNTDLLWRPIPIRMIPDPDDAIIRHRKHCAKYDRLHTEEMEKDYMRKILKENQEFFEYVSEKSGENISTLKQLRNFFDIFLTQVYFNVTLPVWAKDAFKKMECLAIIEINSYTCTTELARMKSGPLIDIIISHFENVIKEENIPKFLMYSAHDTTLIHIMNSMQIYDSQWPEFASMLIFELRKDNEKHFVNILYKNSAGLAKLKLRGCEFDCDMEKFQEILAPVRINLKDWLQECLA